MGRRRGWGVLCACFAVACGSLAEEPPEPAPEEEGCVAGEVSVGEACVPAGLPLEMACAPGELDLDGVCQPAGLPVEAPPSCEPGSMAAVGDAACHEIAPCGTGAWGEVPVDGSTEHVDPTYGGGGSDGSAAQPWITIQEAVDAAPAGAIVALAQGLYAENVVIADTAVRLWGRCPALVEIAGSTAGIAAIDVRVSGAEVRGVAVRGPKVGIATSGADVVFDRVYVHDTEGWGVLVSDALGPARVTLSGSLVESAREFGVVANGTDVTVDASVVRGTRALMPDFRGTGVHVQYDPMKGAPAQVVLRSSVIESNTETGVHVIGSTLVLESSVVRDTQPNASGLFGRGIEVSSDPTLRASATLRSSLIDRNHDVGLSLLGADALLEGVLVRDTVPVGPQSGRGINLQPSEGQVAGALIVGSVIERNESMGIFIGASQARVETTVVRDISPGMPRAGRAIDVVLDPETFAPASVELHASLIERNEVGMALFGSTGTITSSHLRDSARAALAVQGELGVRAQATVTSLLAERSGGTGIVVTAANVSIDGAVVRETSAAADASFGDGISALAHQDIAVVSIARTLVEANLRAGVSSFGSAIALGASTIRCNEIDLDGELYEGHDYAFDDLGGNLCGCPESDGCKVLSSALAPPEALAPGSPPPGP